MAGEKERRETGAWLKFLFFLVILHFGEGTESNPYKHTEVLDKDGKYVLEWLVNWEEDRIYFNVTVETLGYIGFGLSRKGMMAGSDLVIGGVNPNGRSYFRDYHVIGTHRPVVDSSQDWTLHVARETRTDTFLSFSRRLETCDSDDDLPITEDSLALLWSYGESDRIEYHYQNRGSFAAYLLDPDLTPKSIRELHYRNVSVPPRLNSLGNWKVWSLELSEELPTQDTTYYCTFHKAPRSSRKQHIVGMRTVLDSAVEQRHVHHFIFTVCYPPEGVDPDTFFGPFVGRSEECYVHLHPATSIPSHYCMNPVHEWAVGAGPIFFPEHVGLPFTESENEYYLLQVHYDNPQGISNQRLNYALEVYYTDKLREHDAGMMHVGATIALAVTTPPLVMIPPSELNHELYGICPAQCSRKMFPSTRVNVFAAMSHTHLTGRRTRMLQIRNGREEPILVDDNYKFSFQATRILRREKTISAGDVFGHWCSFETTDKDGNATVRGYGTREEMCHGFIWYYPYSRNAGTYGSCSSEIRSPVYAQFLQINTTYWSQERRIDIVTSPPQTAGLTTQEAGTRINWTATKRATLQVLHRELPHVGVCASVDPVTITNAVSGGASTSVIRTPHGDIIDPSSEFLAKWPQNVISYQKQTRCPRRNF